MEKTLAHRIMVCWWKLMKYPMNELAEVGSTYVGTLEAALEIIKLNEGKNR